MNESTADHRVLLLQALQAVEGMKERLRASEQAGIEPIAIVGASCRFPGAQSGLDSYWEVLAQGRDVVREIPPSRWPSGTSPKEDAVWYGGLLDNIDQFDPMFFGISAREATVMDPQHRMVLETAWEALEKAGQNPVGLHGSMTGVFIGITGSDYSQIIHDAGQDLRDIYTATGNASNAAAGRLSFVLGLRGPSVSVDTACSSSLVAIHLACQSLRTRDCRMALAGGVNALISQEPFIYFFRSGMMAPDGHCKPFDDRGDGFVRGEGCGVVVLKRLSDAVADGDRVLALIRGSAVNHDGRSSGLTVPNGPAQEAVIRSALDRAGLRPDEIDYVEAHGTGTSLGDPIEANALSAVLSAGRTTSLLIGSVKANIGHLEAAAGVAGLLKVVLALQHGLIPAQLHFRRLNPHIDWTDGHIEIPVSRRPWSPGVRPRRAGVSSFGVSGTNAHVVVEEAPEPAPRTGTPRSLHVLPLSARTQSALTELERRYAVLAVSGHTDLVDMCYTAGAGRAHFAVRSAYVAGSADDLLRMLRDAAPTAAGRAPARGGAKVAFLFTGQAAQYADMGRELYTSEPAFRHVIDECDAHDLLYGANAQVRLDDTRFAQPALFALQCALAALWQSWGVQPAAVLGHSVGEYAAACVAGACSMSDGLRLISARGRLMGALPAGGAMAAILATADRVRSALTAGVSIAALNGSANTVISGPVAAVEKLCTHFEGAGVRVERLRVSHAFHSTLMEPMADEFSALAAAINFNTPRVRFVSSVTGRQAAGAELRQPGYWRRQILDAVRFGEALHQLLDVDAYLEIGPGSTLLGLGRTALKDDTAVWAPSIRRKRDDNAQMAESLAALYARGVDVNWEAYAGGRGGRRVALPTYPFERRRHWIDVSANRVKGPPRGHHGGHPLLGERVEIADCGALWQSELSLAGHPWINDHRVQDSALVPATLYIELALAAAFETFGDMPVRIENAVFKAPLFLADDITVRIQSKLSAAGRFEVYSRQDGRDADWTLHAVADVCRGVGPNVVEPAPESPGREIGREDFYRLFAERGNTWGPSFQGVAHARVSENDGWSCVDVVPALSADFAAYRFHPALADACGHILPAIREFAPGAAPRAFVGQSFGTMTFHARPKGMSIRCHARLRPSDDRSELVGDVTMLNEDGTLFSRMEGAVMRFLEVETQRGPKFEDWFYEVAWRPTSPGAPSEPAPWILLSDEDSLSHEVAANIRASGLQCSVLPADETTLEGFTPGSSTRIVYFGALSAVSPESSSHACATVLRLARSLASVPGARLFVLTRGAQAVEGPVPETSVWQAPVWGLCRTLAVEHSEMWGGLLDLDPSDTPQAAAEHLWQALTNAPPEDQMALRDGRLLAARLERTRAPSPAPPPVHPDGSYLITGGFGGLGLEVARWLVGAGARRLILLARTPLPSRAEWSGLTPGTSLERMASAVRQLELAGAEVHTASIDVGDETAVRAFLESWTRECRPPIRGVVHTAGLLRVGLAASITMDDLKTVLRPKFGAFALHRLFDKNSLDFFVLFSSGAAVLGLPGIGAYAAANAFLDALASARSGSGLPAVSINWGSWKESGMAARLDAADVQSYSKHGMGGMTTTDGLKALGGLLSGNRVNCAVLPVDWAKWTAAYSSLSSTPMMSALRLQSKLCGSTSMGALREILAVPLGDRRKAIEGYLLNVLATISGFAASVIEPQRSVIDLGLDSLMSLEMKNRVLADTGVSLPIVRLLEGANIEQLGAEIGVLLTKQSPAQVTDRELLARADELNEADLDAALARLLAKNV